MSPHRLYENSSKAGFVVLCLCFEKFAKVTFIHSQSLIFWMKKLASYYRAWNNLSFMPIFSKIMDSGASKPLQSSSTHPNQVTSEEISWIHALFLYLCYCCLECRGNVLRMGCIEIGKYIYQKSSIMGLQIN